MLLAALIVGAAAAVLVMRAAHGRPYSAALPGNDVPDPAAAARRIEADRSERALGWGVRLVFGCVALLTSAVAVTWYGPEKDKPRIEVQMLDNSRWCGEVVLVRTGWLTIKTAKGQVAVDLSKTATVAATDACPN